MVDPGIKMVVLFSGKRKSGKDYLTEILLNRLGDEVAEIIRISAPIKEFWATTKNLNLDELLSDGPYKEQYRKQMIDWSDEMRTQDFGIFCRDALSRATKPIVIVSDVRRKTDIQWFRETCGGKVKTVRIHADDSVREARGWKFQTGVDDIQSECDLDNFEGWDFRLTNESNNAEELLSGIFEILEPLRKTS